MVRATDGAEQHIGAGLDHLENRFADQVRTKHFQSSSHGRAKFIQKKRG
jgi:hypothetical protein